MSGTEQKIERDIAFIAAAAGGVHELPENYERLTLAEEKLKEEQQRMNELQHDILLVERGQGLVVTKEAQRDVAAPER